MYKIKEYSYKQAEKLKVIIRPSTIKKKKNDVYKNNKKIASIGNVHYKDYPSFIEEKGKKYADERRKLYKNRFKNTMNIKNTPSFFATKILW